MAIGKEKNMSISETPTRQTNGLFSCTIRLVKGMLVGIGAIVPGLSGGVLMVIFGIYEPLIKFLANIRKNFIENILFFIPIGIGGVIGMVAFSALIDYAFTYCGPVHLAVYWFHCRNIPFAFQDRRQRRQERLALDSAGGHDNPYLPFHALDGILQQCNPAANFSQLAPQRRFDRLGGGCAGHEPIQFLDIPGAVSTYGERNSATLDLGVTHPPGHRPDCVRLGLRQNRRVFVQESVCFHVSFYF